LHQIRRNPRPKLDIIEVLGINLARRTGIVVEKIQKSPRLK
jgi:hypothetical protein